MPRQPKPFRRLDVSGHPWYGRVRGKKVWLAEGTATLTEARKALTAALAASPAKRADEPLTTREVINLFLHHCKGSVVRGELEQVTLDGYERNLLPARDAIGRVPAADLKPADVFGWIDSRTKWGPTSRYNAATAVKRAFRWAHDMGHLAVNPVASLRRPSPKRRTSVLTPDQIAALIDSMPPADPFRLVLEALRHTGCRPGELARLEVGQVDLDAGTWKVRDKIRRTTGSETRTVYLSPRAVEVTRLAAGGRKTGCVFLNTAGRPWTRFAITLRMAKLSKRLGLPRAACVAYSFRHDFATTALERGISPATVAELMGHRSLTMVMRIYNGLHARTSHLREAASMVRSDGGDRARNPE